MLAIWLALRLRFGLRASDVDRYLAHDMHEYVTEPDSPADGDSQLSCKHFVVSKQPDGVTVVGRRPSAFRRADVLATSTQASIAVTKVYFTPRSQMGS